MVEIFITLSSIQFSFKGEEIYLLSHTSSLLDNRLVLHTKDSRQYPNMRVGT